MYNFIITQVSPIAVLKATFCTGVCFGGILGIMLGFVEGDAIGLFGGVFLGFMSGLLFGISGLACAAIFNVLVPRIGGIAVTLKAANQQEDPPNQPEPQAPLAQ